MKAVILATLLLLSSPWVKTNIPQEQETIPEPEVTVTVSTEAELFGNSEQVTDDERWEYSAVCTITHYCNCSVCCGKWANSPTASGAWPVAGRTVAVDKSVIPLGSEVLINGTVYIAEDTGVSGNWIDIFCDSHQEALSRGLYQTEVKWR